MVLVEDASEAEEEATLVGRVDPVGEADVEVAEVKVESAIFRLQMLMLDQMVEMAQRVVRV